MNNKSKIVIHPGLILIFSIIRFSYIAGRRSINEHSSEKLSEIELNTSVNMHRKYSPNTLQSHQRNKRDSNFGSSSEFLTKEVTHGLPNNMNTDELQGREPADDKPSNVIKLVLPKGELEVSITSRNGNESREAMELLVQSLKSAINRLGYSVHLTTPDMKTNGGTDRNRAVDHAIPKENVKTLADLKRKSVVQGVRDLVLNNPDETNDEENAIYDRGATVGSSYTEYDELYGYNHNYSIDSGSKPEEYAYPVDQDQDNDAGRDLSDYNSEEQRAITKGNTTASGKKSRSTEEPANNYDHYMVPAEDEYENFGRATNSAPCYLFRVSSTDPMGSRLIRNWPQFYLIWTVLPNKLKYF